MIRAAPLAAPPLLRACTTTPTPERIRTQSEAECTRRGLCRLLPPKTRTRPECLAPGQIPTR